MICPVCGGNVYTDFACDGCGVTYDDMINAIRHDNMKRLMGIKPLDENEETELVEEIRSASFLVPATFKNGEFQSMTVEDESDNTFLLLFTDREKYDRDIRDIPPITNPFNLVLDLLDERFEGFVVNILGEAFVLNREFLNRHFGGE